MKNQQQSFLGNGSLRVGGGILERHAFGFIEELTMTARLNCEEDTIDDQRERNQADCVES